ncbi:MAG: 2-aminoethylphosphonate--pyruvate transaminase [Betaproteobacteria bacterium]|nr:2-aminoethylphosphonate--pyruvate transaminase [Betaproteobacteria bacterium]
MATRPDPILLTPGPLTTALGVKQRMLHDWGSRDTDFIGMTADVVRQINDIAGGGDTHACVPMQGSGTFVVEAMIGTLVPRNGHVLVCVNGEYGRRIVKICDILGRRRSTVETPEDQPTTADMVHDALAADGSITHVVLVHCETSTGILNPLEEIAKVVSSQGRSLLVDAMSSFAALPIDARKVRFDALVAASGKCLESVPGMGFAVVRKEALEPCAGNSHSLSLDLHDQHQYYLKTKQWRFTPPVQVVAALHEALRLFNDAGGQAARYRRYRDNCDALVRGLTRIGLVPFLKQGLQAPIIVTFHAPSDAKYDFNAFYGKVRERGYTLYPGKLTQVETFRVGCIGAIGAAEIQAAVDAMAATLKEMGVTQLAPARPDPGSRSRAAAPASSRNR